MAAGSDKEALSRTDRIALRISVIQTVLAVTGFFVGVIALYAALNEADAVRKQMQASVWPYVRITDQNYGIPGEERFEVVISNKGIGPARLKSVSVTVDGEEKTSWFGVINTVAGGERFGISNQNLNGAVLAANEDVTAVSLDIKHASKQTIEGFRDLVRNGRANMVVCYCSVFDSCWRHDAQGQETTPVKKCPEQNPNSQI